MGKKDNEFEYKHKFKKQIFGDKIENIFCNHPQDFIAGLNNLGFEYFEDDNSEEIEERNAKPENQRQRDLIAYFENKKKFSMKIFEGYLKEKESENPNYPLLRRYFKEANQNLKSLITYGIENYPSRIDLLSDLAFFHEFEKILNLLITYYTKACVYQVDLDTFTELAKDFYYLTKPDGYNAYHALRETFEPETDKRKIIEFLIFEDGEPLCHDDIDFE